jgi:N-acetylmuramic acid 6-phosphate etherase
VFTTPLEEQIFVKIWLNQYSLFLMAHLGRFESNIMTWVRPSNGKLIDRTVRYLDQLIEYRKLPEKSFETRVRDVVSMLGKIKSDESVILKLLDQYSHEA